MEEISLNTLTYIRKAAVVALAVCASAFSYAFPITGGLGIAGSALHSQLGIDFSNVGVTPDGILDNDWSSTFVLVADGDLASLEISDDILITDLAFNLSLPGSGLWLTNNNGFNFNVASVLENDSGNPLFKDYTGTGYISLTGFDTTFASWHYSTTNGKTYTLSIIAEPDVTVPEPSSISLLFAASGLVLLSRRIKR
jgi:hypothetical protein